MTCDCSDLAYGALLMSPLECKTILGPFERDFVLTDIVFDLYNYPNGDDSKAGGFVWNSQPNMTRRLVGGRVTDLGRQYHLQSGILCPAGSSLNICSSYFVNEPTALFSARVMGCYCDRPWKPPFDVGPVLTADWAEIGVATEIDPIDPLHSRSRGSQPQIITREVVASESDVAGSGDLRIQSAEGELALAPGSAAAFRVERAQWRWSSSGKRAQTSSAPEDTSLVVARRSSEGHVVHWAMYRESELVF